MHFIGAHNRVNWTGLFTQTTIDTLKNINIKTCCLALINFIRCTLYENGRERCIACKLCEAVCPAQAITIECAPDKVDQRKTTRFDIDVFKCINCGLCEEACPVDSIVCTDEMHYTVLKRGDNIMTKDDLLAVGDMYESSIAKNRDVIHREIEDD